MTGAAGGIGAASARRLSREGAALVLADKNADGVRALAEEITAAGGKAVAAPFDQTVPEEVTNAFASVIGDNLDICFANAGWGRTDPILSMDPGVWKRTMDINVFGTFLVCQAAAKVMAKHGRGGSIIVTASTGAVQPAALFAAYCAAKAAVNMLTKVMAIELGPLDIRVNSIMPGVTETAMTEGLVKTKARDLIEYEVPLGRLATPEDMASAVAFLAGDESRYMTGTALLIDGGALLNGAQWFSTDNRKRGEANWRLRHEVVKL